MMQGAGAVRSERGSPSTMDKAKESAKKPRLDLNNGHVKQELAAQEAAGSAIVDVRMDKRVLHCPICTLPFKPPVFQCIGGHLACGSCVAQLPCGQCKTCVDGGGFFHPCPMLDAVVSSTTIECPYEGCHRYVTYHDVADHQSACLHAPCLCTEPGCGFVGAPQALAGHLNTVHSMPVRSIKYGKVSRLRVPVSTPPIVLLGEGDNRVFLLTVGALGTSAAAVSVVCARANAPTRPRFTCKMWVTLPPLAVSKEDMILVEMQMRSSTSPGAVVAVDEPTFLPVPRMYLVPSAGHGASMEVPLHIRIDKISHYRNGTICRRPDSTPTAKSRGRRRRGLARAARRYADGKV